MGTKKNLSFLSDLIARSMNSDTNLIFTFTDPNDEYSRPDRH